MNRRHFLQQALCSATLGSTALGSIATFYGCAFNPGTEADPLISPDPKTGLDKAQWQIVSAVQQYLFPSEENSPGAKEIHATKFLHFVLGRPELDPNEAALLRNGVRLLSDLCQADFGTPFFNLDEIQKERILRKMEILDDGYPWLRAVLQYILEALLGDPVYGGNPEGIGWQWLEIKPGFPLPTPDKKHFLL